jgi:hypothetical protein
LEIRATEQDSRSIFRVLQADHECVEHGRIGVTRIELHCKSLEVDGDGE